MSPWTAVLESLHSALIDELTERHPEPKPELGLPVRDNVFRVPNPSLSTILACGVAVAELQGAVFLGTDLGFSKAVSVKEQALWSALLKRAEPEFARRAIQPVIQPPVMILVSQGAAALPVHLGTPGRVVWIPFKFPTGACYLGLGA